MVKSSSGKKGYRSFKVVDMRKSNGCVTKFHGGRYVARSPAAAARKALSHHCSVKRVHGRCALHVKVQETTHGSKGRTHTYFLHRKRLTHPLVRFKGTSKEFKIHYVTKAKSVKSMPTVCKDKTRRQSPGRMRSRRRR